jgi:hypothetical protein
MKSIRVPVVLSCGKSVVWTIWREARVMCVGGASQHTGPMWMMRDHEGYERGLETNWLATVTRVLQIADNYGASARIS